MKEGERGSFTGFWFTVKNVWCDFNRNEMCDVQPFPLSFHSPLSLSLQVLRFKDNTGANAS